MIKEWHFIRFHLSFYFLPKKFMINLVMFVTGTWNITCTYSPFLASSAPKCCVSLSSFYSKTMVPCPICSCACQGEPGSNCVRYVISMCIISWHDMTYCIVFVVYCTVKKQEHRSTLNLVLVIGNNPKKFI